MFKAQQRTEQKVDAALSQKEVEAPVFSLERWVHFKFPFSSIDIAPWQTVAGLVRNSNIFTQLQKLPPVTQTPCNMGWCWCPVAKELVLTTVWLVTGLKSRAIKCHMASALIATGNQRAVFFFFFFNPRFVLGACYHRLACRFLSVTKQETESACGGNEAIKFYEGL